MTAQASPNEREFKAFGFITSKMRSGFLTAVVSLQAIAIVWLFTLLMEAKRDNERMQSKLYEKMINYLKPPVEHLNQAATRVDSLTNAIKTKPTP